jgi:hypothetical protein
LCNEDIEPKSGKGSSRACPECVVVVSLAYLWTYNRIGKSYTYSSYGDNYECQCCFHFYLLINTMISLHINLCNIYKIPEDLLQIIHRFYDN